MSSLSKTSFRGVDLGGDARIDVELRGLIDQPLHFAHGEWAALTDLGGDLVGRLARKTRADDATDEPDALCLNARR